MERSAVRSISVTTRPRRRGERQGRDYRFVTPGQFARMRSRGEFLERARILGHWYATPRAPIERALEAGRDVLLGIDVDGAAQVRKSGLPATTVFLLPPSQEALRERLLKRGTEDAREIRARLERAKRELAQVIRYDYAVVNDRLSEAIAEMKAILRAERNRVLGDKQKCRCLLSSCWKR